MRVVLVVLCTLVSLCSSLTLQQYFPWYNNNANDLNSYYGYGSPNVNPTPAWGTANPNAWWQQFGWGYSQPQTQMAQAPQLEPKNQLWLCLEDIFPANVRAQAGIPADVGQILSSFVTHAYVLHGPTVQQSTGFQLTLENGMDEWSKVLLDVKNADMRNPIEWGKKRAALVQGTSKVSSVQGDFVYANSQKCFHISESKCSNQDISSFSTTYRSSHPTFNLLSSNCVYYACNVLNRCSSTGAESCAVNTCIDQLMYNPMESKTPKCGASKVVLDKGSAANNVAIATQNTPFGIPMSGLSPYLFAPSSMQLFSDENSASMFDPQQFTETPFAQQLLKPVQHLEQQKQQQNNLKPTTADEWEFIPMYSPEALSHVTHLMSVEAQTTTTITTTTPTANTKTTAAAIATTNSAEEVHNIDLNA